MELTREVLEFVARKGCGSGPDACQGCMMMKHTPGGDWVCTHPMADETATAALSLMDERDRYRAALEGLLPLVRDYRDDGAYPEDWQSPELQAALDAARAALEPAQKEAQDAEAGQ